VVAAENEGYKNMCGIAGIISIDDAPVHRREIEAMCEAIVHRGPDEDGFYISHGVGMGMRRLRIIDLETGRQPVRNEDGTVWTVFNGEIYNYKKLRTRLQALGHTFYTSTDTEVIVHLYEEYGDECVQFLRGMFALAIWDVKNKRALIARDRLGIKPLYYTMVNDRFCFASEMKALLELDDVTRNLEWNAVGHLVSYLTTPNDQSILQGIKKLPPGHLMSVSRGSSNIRIEPYWDANFAPDSGRTEESFVEELRALLDESVRLHMVSDVPIGAFLSGGIDSSAVVASMARASDRPIKTFSIGFKEASFDELPAAREVALAFGTDHHEEVLEPDALNIIDKLVWHLDEPFGDSSAIPTYMVSELASKSVKVVLSGDGGDELFAGYERYLVEKKERRYDKLPPFVRRLAGAVGEALPDPARGKNFLTHFGKSGAERYLDASTLFRLSQFPRLFTPDVLESVLPGAGQFDASRYEAKTGNWLSALQYGDLKNYLPLDILTKVDRMSMAHSIETRVPLLDHKLVEFAAKIPPEMQIRDMRTKHIFKSAMKGILSDNIIDRPKHGFAVPLGSWFRGKLDDFARDILLSSRSRQRGIFNPRYVETLLTRHSEGRELELHLWTLISFELWCRRFLDSGNTKQQEQGRAYEVPITEHSRMPWMSSPSARPAGLRN
jgi:asparagine synthase (glutamine-hydrolysing)